MRLNRAWLIAAMGVICTFGPSCASHQLPRSDYGIPRCAAGSIEDLLSVSALQCWFNAPHGRWRILDHQSLYEELVVQVEAFSVRDAELIARRFVASASGSFAEMLIYVQAESVTPSSRIRRVRWTRMLGLETIEFSGPAPR